MFKFFEGALGDILAPVSGPSNALFLAIQHHKDDEVRKMLSSHETDVAKSSDSGYSSIHCACRYNNLLALDLIMSRGIQVNFPDSSGNIPLHYAAKYGHPELCKLLVGKGAFPGARNNVGLTPYDVANNHIVRQYLLPLQFQNERDSTSTAGGSPYPESNTDYQPSQVDQTQTQYSSPPYSNNSNIPPNPHMGNPGHPSSASHSAPLPYSANTSPMSQNNAPQYPFGTPNEAPPNPMNNNWAASPSGPPQQSSYRSPAPLSNNNRVILPDGFHTSASDPELQKKYGHTKNVIDIAPPPTFATMAASGMPGPPQQYGMYSQQNGQGGMQPPTISRYVAYDPYASQAAPAPVEKALQYSPPPSAVSQPFYPPPAVFVPTPYVQNPGPTPSPFAQSVGPTPSAVVPVVTANSSSSAPLVQVQVQQEVQPTLPAATMSATASVVNTSRVQAPPAGAGAATFFSPPDLGPAAFFSPLEPTSAPTFTLAPTPAPAPALVIVDKAAAPLPAVDIDSLLDGFSEVEIIDSNSRSVL